MRLLNFVLIFLPVLAASSAQAASGLVSLQIDHVRRNAELVEFVRLKKQPRSTIIVLHGSGGRQSARRILGFDEAARASGMAIVYPEPLDGRWRLDKSHGDDLAFLKRLVAKLVSDGVSDRRRIYLAGIGSGGLLALQFACEDAQSVAGVAVVDAALPQDSAASCKPSRPTPLLVINGDSDPEVPFSGGRANLADFRQNVVSAEQTVAPFAMAAGCNLSQPIRVQLPHHDSKDPTRVTMEKFSGCKAPVQLFRVDGGGHTIPGRRSLRHRPDPKSAAGPQNHDIVTGRVILGFFRRRNG